MGCTSSQAIIEKSASKNRHHDRETPNQAREKIFLGTDSLASQGESTAADDSCGRGLPEDGMKGSQSIKEETKSQHMGAIKLETERQTSSDILEELRMQGIIKTSCPATKNRTADDAMLVPAERTIQKPPAKLEKLELKQKKLHALSIEHPEDKTREEQLKKELLIDRSSPIISPEKRVQIGNSIITTPPNSFQLPPLSVGTETWTEKEELDENINNGFEDFTMVESDITYNTIHGVF
ncbi:stathmin domain-containing protein 1 isoform X1 [Crotalus tigris]|uniref:stathmin domain-containing protein 1 isoform X1 n=1 Tax=Crotalus tigris TaxID=88082 RepID=UPI00192F8EF1|nr:stathmin domain-containing protein 1 isoform X1 [Crotalus tigris]